MELEKDIENIKAALERGNKAGLFNLEESTSIFLSLNRIKELLPRPKENKN